MEDLRVDNAKKKYYRKLKWLDFLTSLKKNWIIILIFLIIIVIFVFPSFIGNIFGIWFNKLATAFLNNLTY